MKKESIFGCSLLDPIPWVVHVGHGLSCFRSQALHHSLGLQKRLTSNSKAICITAVDVPCLDRFFHNYWSQLFLWWFRFHRIEYKYFPTFNESICFLSHPIISFLSYIHGLPIKEFSAFIGMTSHHNLYLMSSLMVKVTWHLCHTCTSSPSSTIEQNRVENVCHPMVHKILRHNIGGAFIVDYDCRNLSIYMAYWMKDVP